jgi:uncharacterized delta-60 repeat protein
MQVQAKRNQTRRKFFLLFILVSLVGFLAACNPYAVPEETLEPAALVSMVLSPSILNVPADSKTGLLLSLSGVFIFGNDFSFTLLNPPAGISIDPPVLNLSTATLRRFQTVLTLGPNVAPGDHLLTLQVTSGSVVKTAVLDLTVTQTPANATFKLTLDPKELELPRSSSKSIFVVVSRIKGFNQAIDLSLDTGGTPLTGVTASPIALAATAFFGGLTLNASATATPFGERFQTKVKGVAGSVTKQANLNLTVKTPSGEPDKSFAGDGIVTFQIPARAFTLLSNDKLVTASISGTNLLVQRYRVNGTLDTGFSSDGKIEHPSQGITGINSIFALADNSLVVVGSKGTNSSTAVLFKLLPNDQLDTAYGGDGIFSVNMPGGVSVNAAALQTDGKVLLGGDELNFLGNDTNATLVRVLANGSGLDTGFGTRTFSDLKISALTEIELQSDGKILLAGHRGLEDEDAVVGRLLASGAEDSSFEGGFQSSGKAIGRQFDGFFCLAVDRSGGVLAAGAFQRTGGGFGAHMSRFLANGKLDDSFSGNGNLDLDGSFLGVTTDSSSSCGMTVQKDNKPLVLVSTDSAELLVRLTTAGARDTSFAGTGRVVLIGIGNPSEVVVDSRGRIVVFGGLGLARFAP